MTTDRFGYHKIKPDNHVLMKGFILALFIHGVLFFIGGKYFIEPVQYSVQSASEGIEVDLVTTMPQSGSDAVESLTSTTKKQQKATKIVPNEKLTTLPQSDADTVKSITSIAEQRQETDKIMPQEGLALLPQSDSDTVESLISTMEKQHNATKIVSLEELTPLPQPEVDAVKSITSITEQQETDKIMPQEGLATLPKSDEDTDKSITHTTESLHETLKTMPRPSQGTKGTKGTIRTKSKPGYFQNRPPEYPPLAKQMHQEGVVILMVEVDRRGMPVKVEVKESSGYQLLDKAALEAVRHWRFKPERIGDIAIESKVTIPIRFRLEE